MNTPNPEPRCELCALGHNRGAVSHCRRCHATWGMATRTMHCVTCHETFSTPANCDRHQKGTKAEPWGCRPPADRGLVADPNAYGTRVWHQPGVAPAASRSQGPALARGTLTESPASPLPLPRYPGNV